MRRIRQSSSEIYEVTGAEIVSALGLWAEEGDTVTLERVAGDTYKLQVTGVTDEDEEMPVPLVIPAGIALSNWGTIEEFEEQEGLQAPFGSLVMLPPEPSTDETPSLADALRASLPAIRRESEDEIV